MLRCEGLAVQLGDFRLENASFHAAAGDYLVLLGQSGTGKSVILELLAGLQRPTAGHVWIENHEVTHAPIQGRGLGLVYQDHALFPHLSVAANIAYPLRSGLKKNRQQVEQLARQVGAEHLLHRSPATLSLGEAQRVALARALATHPKVLLLDEPLASLDVTAKTSMRRLLRHLNSQGQTVIHVTHDYEEAIALANRVAVLEGGRIVQCGTPDEVFHRPVSQFVAQFIGIRNFFRAKILANENEEALVAIGEHRLHVACSEYSGTGNILLRSEDLTVSCSAPKGSARNTLMATILDMEPARLGVEVHLDASGLSLFALVTRHSVTELHLAPGEKVWVSWKSTAARFIPDEPKES